MKVAAKKIVGQRVKKQLWFLAGGICALVSMFAVVTGVFGTLAWLAMAPGTAEGINFTWVWFADIYMVVIGIGWWIWATILKE